MNSQKMLLEIWTIALKLILLMFVIFETYFKAESITGWNILSYLVFISLSCLILIIPRTRFKQVVLLLLIAQIIWCEQVLNAYYLLLLPTVLLELELSHRRRLLPVLLLLLSVMLVPPNLIPLYVVLGAVSLFGYTIIRYGTDKLTVQGSMVEGLTEDVQRLRRTLAEKQEYVRQSEYTIKLEERSRLSQQIHDEVGHSMAGALIQMEAAKRILEVQPTKAAELLGNAITISRDGLEQIRLTLKDMKPKSEELGINRLRLFIDELASHHSISTVLTHEGLLDTITPLQWKIIQDNVMEAVTNTIKYGKADAVELHIQVLNRLVKAMVTDNGVGCTKVVKGLGIIGMEERAASVGGTVIVDGSNGFSVITLLPHQHAGTFSL